MKLRMLAAVCCLLIGISLAGCAGEAAPGTAGEAVLESVSAPETSAPDPAAEKTPLGEMDYDTYFSIEREWVDESMDYMQDPDYDGSWYFVLDPILYDDGDGRLYKAPDGLEYEETLAKKELVLPDEIGSGALFAQMPGKLLFVSGGVTLTETDRDGGKRRVLFESPEPIGNITANTALIWFQAGNTVYRHHRQSGKTEKLYTPAERIEAYKPLSNDAFYWIQLNDAGRASRASGVEPYSEDAHNIGVPLVEAGVYNAKTDTVKLYTTDEYDENGNVPYRIGNP